MKTINEFCLLHQLRDILQKHNIKHELLDYGMIDTKEYFIMQNSVTRHNNIDYIEISWIVGENINKVRYDDSIKAFNFIKDRL